MQHSIDCNLLKLITHLHKLVNSVWYGGSRWAWLLQPFAWIYGAGVACRRKAYRNAWLLTPTLPLPVVVIGNVTVGGTGKTPLVVWLAAELKKRGLRPGIVSRGYGAANNSKPQRVVATSYLQAAGDEALLLARETGCPVVICRDRVAAVRELARESVDVVLADDGLQHYRMSRQFELVVIDGSRGFGNGRLLPAGPLREPVTKIREADAVLVNGAGMEGDLVRFNLIPGLARSLSGEAECSLASFAGHRVWAVAGIGNPQRFFELLRGFGLIIDEVPVRDHGKTDINKLLRVRQQPVLMTAKDAVKYLADSYAGCWYVPVQVQMAEVVADDLLRRLLVACKLEVKPADIGDERRH